MLSQSRTRLRYTWICANARSEKYWHEKTRGHRLDRDDPQRVGLATLGREILSIVTATDDEAFLAMQARLAALLPWLNERDRRVAMATEVTSWGRGGISAVQRATGASRSTIRRGLADLAGNAQEQPDRRVRAHGGGRKKAEVTDPELLDALDTLIEPETRGDSESPLRWPTKSTRNLAAELTEMGHAVSYSVVAKIFIPSSAACREPARPWKDTNTPTVTPSSGTSTYSPRSSSPAATL